MRRLALLLFIFIPLLPVQAQSQEYDVYKKARMAWFNNEWLEAIKHYNQHIKQFPDSPRVCKSRANVGYCYEKLGDKKMAFETFTNLIEDGNCKKDILTDARSERMKLAFELVSEDKEMKNVLLQGLTDENEDLRFFAAVYLSRLDDPSGIEVFFHTVSNDPDSDRRDIASRHILKLGTDKDKDRLNKILAERQNSDIPPKLIKLVIRNLGTGKEEVNVTLPIKLFQAITKALKDDDLEFIKNETGIDLNKIDINLEALPSGKVLFKLIDEDQREIKIFLE
ncbi:MAG: HEAT repeat domain-containing protein [Acidobacteriota bacterium]|nr:HEAT repeat domain-containing protein [Acidobacteriota bacterium]